MLEGRGRLVTEGETVLEKPGTLTTGTTVLQGPMMLLIAGETVLEWPGGIVSCQTVGLHGQPQDWKCFASRLVPEEWG